MHLIKYAFLAVGRRLHAENETDSMLSKTDTRINHAHQQFHQVSPMAGCGKPRG
jgi:hypothetical protein